MSSQHPVAQSFVDPPLKGDAGIQQMVVIV